MATNMAAKITKFKHFQIILPILTVFFFMENFTIASEDLMEHTVLSGPDQGKTIMKVFIN